MGSSSFVEGKQNRTWEPSSRNSGRSLTLKHKGASEAASRSRDRCREAGGLSDELMLWIFDLCWEIPCSGMS